MAILWKVKACASQPSRLNLAEKAAQPTISSNTERRTTPAFIKPPEAAVLLRRRLQERGGLLAFNSEILLLYHCVAQRGAVLLYFRVSPVTSHKGLIGTLEQRGRL